MFTCGSLFTGIGGIDLAFAAAGFDILFQVEIDDFCRKVLEKHERDYWPNATRFTDIRDVGGHNLPKVDVLFGGFPCQDLSVAGKRMGITEGTRSGLWFEFARVIGDLRPQVVLLENVAGILTGDGTIVIADLAKMGYVGQWGALSASDTDAPHRRERWFCVAYHQPERFQEWFWGNSSRQLGQSPKNNIPAFALSSSLVNAQQLRPCAGTSGETRDTQANERRDDPQGEPGRDAEQSGVVGTGELANAAEFRCEQYQQDTGSIGTGKNERRLFELEGTSHRPTEPCLGGNVARIPAGLDGHQWPARPGQPQHPGEPPRVTTERENRAARLKALGNAVVPQVVYPIAQSICEWLAEGAAVEAVG
jgi:DNA (cytosine-5)-methyltransferase 1